MEFYIALGHAVS